MARHAGVELAMDDWQRLGWAEPLLVNCQPAGEYLGEGFHKAGGVPAVMGELLAAKKIHGDALTVSGRTVAENIEGRRSENPEVIRSYDKPLMHEAGFLVMGGNLFHSAIMKTSVIGEAFRARFLSTPGDENSFTGRAIVFEGPEDYHARINDPALDIDESCILFMRNCGPLGYPGSAEVVNMTPPDALVKKGVLNLPCIGDGRQSGTSASPSILHCSPESAVGGGLALLKTGDRVRIDMNKRRVDMLVSDEELQRRKAAWKAPSLPSQTPWEEIFRSMAGQLETGMCLEPAVGYRDVIRTRGESRDSH